MVLISGFVAFDMWRARQANQAREQASLTSLPPEPVAPVVANAPDTASLAASPAASAPAANATATLATADGAAMSPASSIPATAPPPATGTAGTVGGVEVEPQKVDALNKRMDRFEGLLAEVVDSVRSIRERFFSSKPTATAGAPASNVPVATVKKQPKVAVQAKSKPKAEPAVTASVPPPVATQNELLSVDIWDGVPSAVIGTGVAGDKRIKVLRAGDSDHGVTVKSVDLDRQSATFVVSGREVTLSTTGGAR